MSQDNRYTIVIGCGRLGSKVASVLSNRGEGVMVIDKNEESFRKLASSYEGLTYIADAMDVDIYQAVDIERATTVIVCTNADNTNILIANIIQKVYRIKNIIIRLYDAEREFLFHNSGIKTISPTELSKNEIINYLEEETYA